MSSAEKIKTFNLIIESFLAQLSDSIGTTYSVYFKRIIKFNSLIAIESAIKYIIPYRSKIINKDETYFSDENNYKDNIDNNVELNKHFSNDKIMSEIFRLKDIYYNLDFESKENVWNILNALVQLAIEYCDIKGIPIK